MRQDVGGAVSAAVWRLAPRAARRLIVAGQCTAGLSAIVNGGHLPFFGRAIGALQHLHLRRSAEHSDAQPLLPIFIA